MRTGRLGCLSWSGILAMLITLMTIGGVVYARGGLLYNPGPLNAQHGDEVLGGFASHADIGGQCEACHSAPWSAVAMADLCVACHGEIAAQMQNMVALHGSMYQNNSGLECRDCHQEHRGADAPLTVLQDGAFPHELLGYSLDGHRLTVQNEAFTCGDCHGDDISIFAPSSCDTCHRQMNAAFAQAHALSYGTVCLDCHDGVDSLGERFSHNTLAYKLTGKHQDAACVKCHTDARNLADFKNAPQDCYTCHRTDDQHQGRFGADCSACHSPNDWEPANFDHNLSGFKLEGEHAEAACEDCHQNGVYQGTPKDCYSCHQQEDEHNGRFGMDCGTCHSPNGWEPATFDHNLSGFKLEGEHAEAACEDCHQNGVYQGTPKDCYSCHQREDEHNGRFGTDCGACHSPTDWDNATFDHNRSNFPLDGSHVRVACEQCHVNNTFAGLSTDCVACHADPGFHIGSFGANCQDCHNTSVWSPARFNLSHPEPRVDEEGTGVNHGYTTCRTCHPDTVRAYTCLACHSDNQGGEGEEHGDD